jgi:hypothetical protein
MSQERIQRAHVLGTTPIMHPTIFYDNCDGTFDYVVTGTGADFAAAYVTTYALSNLKSLLAQTKLTTPAVADYVDVAKNLWLPPTKLVRLQLAFRLISASTGITIQWGIKWYDGVNVNTAHLRVDRSTLLTQYYNAAGSWTTITGPTCPPDPYTWSYYDLVADFTKNEYVRMTASHVPVSLAGTPVNSSAGATRPKCILGLIVTAGAAVRAECAFSQILLTGENL